jgi:glycosyltransferase involved in cell wall biosynthesis
VTFAAAAFAGVPHIVFCIRTVNPKYYDGVGAAAERRLWRAHRAMHPLVSRIIVNSTVLQKDYAEWLGIDPARITPCPNGIDPHVLEAAERARKGAQIREHFGIPDDALLIVNVGRFSAEKGQFTILAANEILMSRFPAGGFWWLLCGDGVLLPQAKTRAESGGSQNVVFAGRTNEVPAVLAAADVFVMASDLEGMPNAMMEAMTFGLPCVSTNVTGARDIARDGVEALYCPPGDGAALADRIETLLRDPGKARALGEASARRIREFSVARSREAFDRAFAPLLRLPSPS